MKLPVRRDMWNNNQFRIVDADQKVVCEMKIQDPELTSRLVLLINNNHGWLQYAKAETA